MGHEALKERVCEANCEIQRTGLAIHTWGNASEVDREAGVFAIKPSGVSYDALRPADIPLVSLESGERIEGTAVPSSDTATHWHLYRSFESIGGIVHAHSPHATAWAQAMREIPCFGTTHADAFHGPVPCTRKLTQEEVQDAYELNTGKVIAEHFVTHQLEPMAVPGVLVASHAAFAWGKDAWSAVVNGRTLEEVARMAHWSLLAAPSLAPIDDYLLDKHYFRKHGKNAYYGQA